MSATATLPLAEPLPAAAPRRGRTAVLVGGCDGYAAGTTGDIVGERGGCLVFAPHEPERVARWARPRSEIVVPPELVVAA